MGYNIKFIIFFALKLCYYLQRSFTEHIDFFRMESFANYEDVWNILPHNSLYQSLLLLGVSVGSGIRMFWALWPVLGLYKEIFERLND